MIFLGVGLTLRLRSASQLLSVQQWYRTEEQRWESQITLAASGCLSKLGYLKPEKEFRSSPKPICR